MLIVEDNPALAYNIHDIFCDHGAEVIGPALDLMTGLQLARENDLDGAVLDIDLGGDYVWPLARELKGHRIPLVFVSAEHPGSLPDDFIEFVFLEKPAADHAILTTVEQLLNSD
ncbi:hypothetical protein [Qipengyuania sp.]|uniref:hypothetical protein n=1 Tax=Qipengyuania sp. TaxID=2004515 RepID=UPI0035C7A40A